MELAYGVDTRVGELRDWEPVVEALDCFVEMDLPLFIHSSMIF